MRFTIFCYTLPALLWHVFTYSSGYTQTSQAPVRIALMPFCDESTELDQSLRPDAQKMYNYTISALKELSDCSQTANWISKNRTGKSIASYITKVEDTVEITSSCDYYLTESVCQNIQADIIVLGEYILDTDKTVEVYYSFENCEGIYTSGIEYLTSQPITGSSDDLAALYTKVSNAIKMDLQNFLDCKTGLSINDTQNLLEEGKAFYRLGEESALNYLKSIAVFEEILTSPYATDEASYFLGLAYFSLGEYAEADSYFSKIEHFKEAKSYRKYCTLESKPAIWYNTVRRRRIWWNDLNSHWKIAINTQVLNLNPKGTPTDTHLDSLFQMTALSIKDIFLPDFVAIEALSNITQLSCNKTFLYNLNGIEKLTNLGQISINQNKITSLKALESLPLLTRIYCRNNPLENLEGVENMNVERAVIFCGGSVPGKEMRRIRELGIQVQP